MTHHTITVLQCAGLQPESPLKLCEKSDECAHYEEQWIAPNARPFSMNLCTQAGGQFKMFTPWRPLIQSGAKFDFVHSSPQGYLFA